MSGHRLVIDHTGRAMTQAEIDAALKEIARERRRQTRRKLAEAVRSKTQRQSSRQRDSRSRHDEPIKHGEDAPEYLPTPEEIDRMKRQIRAENEAAGIRPERVHHRDADGNLIEDGPPGHPGIKVCRSYFGARRLGR